MVSSGFRDSEPLGDVHRLRAGVLWAGPASVWAPGELEWDRRGWLTYVGPVRSGVVDHVVTAVVPGAVNAHAHLQLAPLDRVPRESFPVWVARVAGSRNATSFESAADLVQGHLRALVADGCVAVGEVDSMGTSAVVAADVSSGLGVPVRWYQEVLGFDVFASDADALVQARAAQGDGLSPHAPYSTSADLFRSAAARGLPMTIHVAELEEEQELLRTGSGPLRELLTDLGRLPVDWSPPGVGAVEYLVGLGVLGPGVSAVHCQHLLPGDVERLREVGSPVVVCPGTIDWFDRTPPPVPEWLAAGLEVALGTDSLASNHVLSMRREMGLARRMWPELSSAQILAMATISGGRAMGMASAGTLAPGTRADFVELGEARSAEEVLERWTWGQAAPQNVWMSGRVFEPDPRAP